MIRIHLLKVLFSVFALLIVGKTIYLQLGKSPELDRLAKRQFQTKISTLPQRGHIFDRNGEGLAISLKVRSLFFRPEMIRKDLAVAQRARILGSIAKIIKAQASVLQAKASSTKGFVWVKRHLTAEEEQAIRDRGLLDYSEGIALVEETKRFYPNRELAAHVLGSVGVDGQGLEGLELQYENSLQGEKTRVASLKDARGRRIFKDGEGLLAFKNGSSLVLTIDKTIQYESEKWLRASIDENGALAGSVLVADAETGEILALANYPTFNPNEAGGAKTDARRNRAITDGYEPGSTFKPFVVAMALESGLPATKKIYCEKGSFVVGGRRISEAEAKEKFEWLTLGEILKYSSNVGSAKLAMELGSTKMNTLFDKLGFGKRTGVDLPGEATAQYGARGFNSVVRLANVGFGHGFMVTPIQMLSAYVSLANGGKWAQPRLVKAVLSEDPDSIENGAIGWKAKQQQSPAKMRAAFSQSVALQVGLMLESVTKEGGTGVNAQLGDWTAAGKTGTAQKVDPITKKYSRKKYIASFAGFAPAKGPKLVALVVIDEPKKNYYGAQAAAPVFREVMRSGLLRERVPAENTEKMQELVNRDSIDRLESSLNFSGVNKNVIPEELERNEMSQVKLPDMRGYTVREALRTISSTLR